MRRFAKRSRYLFRTFRCYQELVIYSFETYLKSEPSLYLFIFLIIFDVEYKRVFTSEHLK